MNANKINNIMLAQVFLRQFNALLHINKYGKANIMKKMLIIQNCQKLRKKQKKAGKENYVK